MLFENNDFDDLNALFNIGNYNYAYGYNNNFKDAKVDENEGFLKGNMFTDEYKPYKDYTYIMPKINSEREKALFNIMNLSFMINDYNLYLDLHPEDTDILNKFKSASEKLEVSKKKYEEKYGPLEVCDVKSDSFDWINSPWPWDKKDGMYV